MKYLTDLLPIKDPLQYEPEDRDFFYTNIVKPLIEDIVQITNNGIPININKVAILEKELLDTLEEQNNILKNNFIIQKFIATKNDYVKTLKSDNVIPKSFDSFINKFDNSKIIHINYLIDAIVDELIEQKELTNDFKRITKTNWTQKKLKDIYNITNSPYIKLILEKDYNNSIFNKLKITAMLKLAEDKYNIELKKVELKKEEINNKEQYNEFNPSSSTQIQELFEFIGLDSRIKTATGNDSYNKEALKELLEIVNNRIYQLEEQENE